MCPYVRRSTISLFSLCVPCRLPSHRVHAWPRPHRVPHHFRGVLRVVISEVCCRRRVGVCVAGLRNKIARTYILIYKMNSGARDAAQTGHKRQATKTGRHVVTQGSLGDGGVLRRRGEPELGRNLFRPASCSATDMRWACSESHDRVDQLASSSCCRFESLLRTLSFIW